MSNCEVPFRNVYGAQLFYYLNFVYKLTKFAFICSSSYFVSITVMFSLLPQDKHGTHTAKCLFFF